MTDKNKNNTGKTEIQWRDRLLLESLIAQILPGLIISDHDKANKIIEMINPSKDVDIFRNTAPIEMSTESMRITDILQNTLKAAKKEIYK